MDIKNLIAQLTLEEKAQLLTGRSNWETTSIERLNIPSIRMMDGPHGLRFAIGDEFGNNKPATCFPSASCMGSSWDVDLLHQVGEVIGKECQAEDVQIILGPGVNMKRSPLGGRNFEYYSEDPVLSGELAAGFINGVQSQHVGTSLKHFTANNQEFERRVHSCNIDPRTLREIYLPAFEIAVKKSRPWTVMSAYNRVNEVYATEDKFLLTDILREEWGFEGFVVSDWGATYDRVASVKAGLGLEMPFNPTNAPLIIKAVEDGELDEKDIDKVLESLLAIIFKADNLRGKEVSVNHAEHHKIARKVASESMVLLKNENDLLPLKRNGYERVVVIGGFAKEPRFMGGGSSEMNPTQLESPLNEIREYLDDETELLFVDGYDEDHETNAGLMDEAGKVSASADLAILFVGLPHHYESEEYDRTHMFIPDSHVRLITEVSNANENTIVVLMNGSSIDMRQWKEKVPAILEAWLGGQAAGGAIADILFGEVNPCGKLSETFPLRLEDNPSYLSFPGGKRNVNYDEGIFTGYRWYDSRDMHVNYPFGFGLSYTTFEYSDISLDANSIKDSETLKISFKLENTGDRAGKEVVQLYVSDEESVLPRPSKELKDFRKVYLEPGEEREVTFELDGRAFAYYDPYDSKWVIEPGTFEILIGASSRDIRLRSRVSIESTHPTKVVYDKYSTLGEILKDKERAESIKPVLTMVAGAMGEDLDNMDDKSFMYHVFQTMPLAKLVNFGRGAFTNDVVDEMIKKLNQD